MLQAAQLVAAAAAVRREHQVRINEAKLEKRLIRDRSNPFQLPEKEFKQNYRLPAEFAFDVVQELSNHLPETQRITAVPNEIKVLTAINFLATGSYQRPVGNSVHHALSQPVVSRCVELVTNAIEERYLAQWIKFPNEAEMQENKEYYYRKCRLQGCIASVDGTQVEFVGTQFGVDFPEEIFVNRHGWYGINAMIIANMKHKIHGVNSRFPGSAHDGYVWRGSQARAHMVERWENGDRHSWLLGDSGYSQEPWLMKPFDHPAVGSREAEYNKRQKKGRCAIERTIGLMKNWWRCLNSARGLHYHPSKVGHLINACAVLHNMCIHCRLDEDVADHDLDLPDDEDDESDEEDGNFAQLGRQARDRLVASMPWP